MKKLVYLLAISIAIVSCNKEPKDYVTFSGKITNKSSNTVVISNPQYKFKKEISVDENGVFNDTMNVKTGYYRLFDGKEYATLYLQNGAEVKMTMDAAQFDETISFTGNGSNESSFLAKTALLQEELLGDQTLLELPEDDFNAKVSSFETDFNKRISEATLDSTFTANQKQNFVGLKKYVTKTYDEKKYIAKNLAKGMLSPKFVNYENHKGGMMSLDDLKGKYVYIDMWATWCNPCKQEIPYLKKVEDKYHGKNIAFVSISVDREKDYETWKNMVSDMNLGGIQLYSKRDQAFSGAYKVNSIPRFILLDPQGNIVDANAPRPSNPKLIKMFEDLKI